MEQKRRKSKVQRPVVYKFPNDNQPIRNLARAYGHKSRAEEAAFMRGYRLGMLSNLKIRKD